MKSVRGHSSTPYPRSVRRWPESAALTSITAVEVAAIINSDPSAIADRIPTVLPK
ncbi:hypothetical protein C6A86_026970 [Mycobacterium sp. ITM-2016-00316]|uniref:hypothetical protein n=1 Tax=Mycobacterium sp. ITM-2016-00316 TaxID=2099695 RepID=UPI001304B1EA|nr:hypothetical protein [Mycobacterium sp. ITM-2016-00316]WNG81753.1 hypothetical protein C6A86_026970 [Mycobacterium sp. ITM-2016-00316]